MAAQPVTSLSTPDFEAWVEVDGQKAVVYGASLAGNKRSGYIESKAGSNFTVNFKFMHLVRPQTDITTQIYVDGSRVEGIFARKEQIGLDPLLGTYQPPPLQVVGVRANQTEILPFKFKKISLTDDMDKADSTEGFIKNLGKIEVKVSKVVVLPDHVLPQYNALEDKSVHERMKKATLSHQAGVGQPVQSKGQCSTASKVIPVDQNGLNYLHFEFCYLSRDLLEFQGLIKPEPESKLTVEQENELLRREVEELRKQVGKRVKQEDGVGGEKKKQKLSNLSGTAKPKGKVKAEVIIIDSDSDAD